jgi:hypothetical protein
MAYSVYTLNNRINYLQDQINNGIGTVNTLQEVIDKNDSLQGSVPTLDQVIKYDGTNVIWDSISTTPQTLQETINAGYSLQSQAPTTSQFIGFDGTNVIWDNVDIPNLQHVLDTGNNANQSIILNDSSALNTNTINNNSLNIINENSGFIGIGCGDINTTGTASVSFNSTTATSSNLNVSTSGISAPPFFSPPQAIAQLNTTQTTSSLNLSYSGQYTTGKQLEMNLEKLQHQSDGSLDYSIISNGYLNLNSGDSTYGFKKVRINTTAPNYKLEIDNNSIRASQISAPTFYSELQTSQILCENTPAGRSYMTYGGYTTSNNTQYVALQPTQLLATNDFKILTQTTGDISIEAKDQIKLKALDLGGTGNGIVIDKLTPNIYYQLNTLNVFDRLVIDNTGLIETISVTNSTATSIRQNNIVLQNIATSTSCDITGDGGIIFYSGATTPSSFSPSQLSFYTGSSPTSTMNNAGFRGSVYHTDQPTTNQIYYLSFVQSNGVAGYYPPCFDSATLTYNPSFNILTVNALALNTGTTGVTYSGNSLSATISGTSGQTNQEFKWTITTTPSNITTFNLTNRRQNGVYRIYIINNSGGSFVINKTLSGTATNKTNFNNTTIGAGETWIMEIQVVDFGTGNAINAIDLKNYS